MDVVSDIVAPEYGKAFAPLENGLGQEGDMETVGLDGAAADAVDGDGGDDCNRDAVRLTDGSDGRIGVGMHMRRAKRGDSGKISGVMSW